MKKYVFKRMIISVGTLMVIVLILFLLLNLMPGSPFNDHRLKADQIATLYQKYGLDRPVFERYWKYLFQLLQGDFGVSYNIQQNMDISKMFATRFPITIQIGMQGLVLGVIFGILLGILAALKHNTWLDPVISCISMLGASIPSFVFALGLVYFVAFKTGILPILYSSSQPFASTILPSIALAMFPMSNIARYTRAEMISVLSSDYILLAEAKGLKPGRIIRKHVLRNSLVPILTVIAPMVVELITGSMVVENIFSIPGIGSLFVMAIRSNDYNVAISIMFIYSACYIGLMLVVDILYGLIDPRVRLAGGEK